MSTRGPTRLPWPPVILIVAVAAGFLLRSVLTPLAFLPAPFDAVLMAFGYMLIALALALDIYALLTLRRAKTAISPMRSAERLVTTGPYAFSRNPIYLGNTLIVLALGFVTNSAWFVALALLGAAALTRLQIVSEERHLSARFGRSWTQYAKRVNRWF